MRRGQGRAYLVDLLGGDDGVLATKHEVVAFWAEGDSDALTEKHEGKYVAILGSAVRRVSNKEGKTIKLPSRDKL